MYPSVFINSIYVKFLEVEDVLESVLSLLL